MKLAEALLVGIIAGISLAIGEKIVNKIWP